LSRKNFIYFSRSNAIGRRKLKFDLIHSNSASLHATPSPLRTDTSFGKDKERLLLTFEAFERTLFDYGAPILYPANDWKKEIRLESQSFCISPRHAVSIARKASSGLNIQKALTFTSFGKDEERLLLTLGLCLTTARRYRIHPTRLRLQSIYERKTCAAKN
jgi:hypothetical protein